MNSAVAFVLLFLSLTCNGFWQGGGVGAMLQNVSEEGQRRYYALLKRASFTVIGICVVFSLANGRLIQIDICHIIFYLCLVPIIALIYKSIRSRKSIFEIVLFKNKVWNFLALDLPLHYAFVLIWISLLSIMFVS